MDYIQETYNIVCKHLGKPDRRNNIRVSEEHEKLLEDLQKLVSAACLQAQTMAIQEQRKLILNRIQELLK